MHGKPLRFTISHTDSHFLHSESGIHREIFRFSQAGHSGAGVRESSVSPDRFTPSLSAGLRFLARSLRSAVFFFSSAGSASLSEHGKLRKILNSETNRIKFQRVLPFISKIEIQPMQIPAELAKVIEAVQSAGRPYLVGGCVRDWLLGKEPHDFDIEVFETDYEKLRTVLAKFGPTEVVGKSFGVIKVRIGENEYDCSLPRREIKTGSGHRGFDVVPDSSLTLEEASSRRDFTINAIAWDPALHEIVDPHGGRSDLEQRLLRHVGPAFSEDPLRVLRGFQLVSRFKLRTLPE